MIEHYSLVNVEQFKVVLTYLGRMLDEYWCLRMFQNQKAINKINIQ